MDYEKLLEELAAGVHGATCAANVLISIYNWKKGNKKRAALHLGIAVWEGFAFHDHFGGKDEKPT